MPVHDWTRVESGIFHDFHLSWIAEIKRALNAGLLPHGYYALAEQIASDIVPDVITLEKTVENGKPRPRHNGSAVAIAEMAPQARFHVMAEDDAAIRKAKVVKIRHLSDHRVVAVIELVSPGNKNSKAALNALVQKAIYLMQQGVHLLVVDLFPPGPRDPEGIHKAIWDEIEEKPFALPEDKPLVVASYRGGWSPEAYIEVLAAGDPLPSLPIFLNLDEYVPAPLEMTYQKAWETVPEVWREKIEGNS